MSKKDDQIKNFCYMYTNGIMINYKNIWIMQYIAIWIELEDLMVPSQKKDE